MKLFKLQYLLREQASSSLAGFYTDPLSRKPSEQGENYSHIAPGRNRTQATLLGGERFSPLYHSCSPDSLLYNAKQMSVR